jgi:hypothetical protein
MTQERKSRRSRATRTSLGRPRATTRRGKRILPSLWWNDHDVIRSTDPSRVNLKASYITSTFSTHRESTRPGTMTDFKVSQMRCSRQPKGPIRRKGLKNTRVTSLKLTRRSTTSMVASVHMSQGGSRNSQPGKSWQSHPQPSSTLNGLRCPIPLTAATTQTLCQSWGGTLSLSTPSSRMSSLIESSSMEAAP